MAFHWGNRKQRVCITVNICNQWERASGEPKTKKQGTRGLHGNSHQIRITQCAFTLLASFFSFYPNTKPCRSYNKLRILAGYKRLSSYDLTCKWRMGHWCTTNALWSCSGTLDLPFPFQQWHPPTLWNYYLVSKGTKHSSKIWPSDAPWIRRKVSETSIWPFPLWKFFSHKPKPTMRAVQTPNYINSKTHLSYRGNGKWLLSLSIDTVELLWVYFHQDSISCFHFWAPYSM